MYTKALLHSTAVLPTDARILNHLMYLLCIWSIRHVTICLDDKDRTHASHKFYRLTMIIRVA
jgi:hypothetical protein